MAKKSGKFLMERKGTKVSVEGATATVPSTVSMLSVFGLNSFIPSGDYRDDGWIYIKNKPVKKWFKTANNVTVWFPILEDIHKLQDRYLEACKKCKDYLPKYSSAYKQLEKVGQAHAKVAHKYSGDGDPWWLYTSEKYPGYKGISWDWVETPKKLINLETGNAYYKASKRLEQLNGRKWKFRTVLEYAIFGKVCAIKADSIGQVLQFKVGKKIYWFQMSQHSWEKLLFPEDDVKIVQI
jgi:hypothetical protein